MSTQAETQKATLLGAEEKFLLGREALRTGPRRRWPRLNGHVELSKPHGLKCGSGNVEVKTSLL